MEKKKVIKGLVKQVISADYIVLSKSQKGTAVPIEKHCYLANIQAPKMGSTNRTEEPFAFDAREFLRERIIGRKAEFTVEYSFANKDFGVLVVNGENINFEVVKAGFANVIERKGSSAGTEKSPYVDQLLKLQQDAKLKKANIFSTEKKHIEKHTRQVTYYSDASYSAKRIVEESKKFDKPMEGIVEYVFNASFMSVYIVKFQAMTKLGLVHLFTPATDSELVKEGKAFAEKLLLQRTVGVQFDRVDDNGNLYARLHHPAGDIAYEVLKNGFAKLNNPKNLDIDADYFKQLKEAQLLGQTKRVGIWKDFKQAEEKKQEKASCDDFSGKVVEVHSGDSMTVERDGDFQPIRIFLATCKAPAIRQREKDQPEPYGWESKEALRKLVIGKKVNVVMEYSRTIPAKNEGDADRKMDFASVILQKNSKNVSVSLLEQGLLKTNLAKNGDNASKFLEDMLAAEKKAADAKKNMHSASIAPVRVFADFVNNPKQAKDFEAMFTKKQSNKVAGVVEHVFSGMRFKVRLDSENCYIAFNLLGVKTMMNDKNQPELLELSNEALYMARETLFQRDVVIYIEFADKRGSFFGTLMFGGKDFAL